jgi:hypothetical protein
MGGNYSGNQQLLEGIDASLPPIPPWKTVEKPEYYRADKKYRSNPDNSKTRTFFTHVSKNQRHICADMA